MKNNDNLKKLYVDGDFNLKINTDDFLIAIGKRQSNSVYHVYESKKVVRKNGIRFNVKVFKSDLITCLQRNKSQNIITLAWYKRDKKK